MTNYTTRFIEFPVIKFFRIERDNELDENEQPLADGGVVETFCRLNPMNIESYNPDTDYEIPTSENLNCTNVVMKSGKEHLVNMPINDFEAYLDEVYNKIHNQG